MTECMSPRLKQGDANPRTRLRSAALVDRLMYRTALMENGCWVWLGATNKKGYGHIRGVENGPLVAVHRAAYELAKGAIPEGLEVDHLCFERACLNPEHLEAIDHAENVRRGRHNQNHGKAECLNGHAFDAGNTSIDTKGKRVCKTCSRERMRGYRASRKAAA